MITGILHAMGLAPSRHDPCLFTGTTIDPSASTTNRKRIYVGLYVDDFVFFSESSTEEARFEKLLSERIAVDFMGEADFFLGQTFNWTRKANGDVDVLIHQQAFTEHLGTRFGLDNATRTPNMTPYRSGIPITSLPKPDKGDPDQKRRTTVYQSLVGCLNWLAVSTRPDLSTVVAFLASFMNNPSQAHYTSAIYALRYALSSSSYGISFQSNAKAILESFSDSPTHTTKRRIPTPYPHSQTNATNLRPTAMLAGETKSVTRSPTAPLSTSSSIAQ